MVCDAWLNMIAIIIPLILPTLIMIISFFPQAELSSDVKGQLARSAQEPLLSTLSHFSGMGVEARVLLASRMKVITVAEG